MSFIHTIRGSIYSPEFYRGLFSKPFSWSVKYFILLALAAVFPERLQAALDVVIVIAMIGFSAFACVQALRIVAIMAANGQVSITAEIPMTVPYAAFVVGFGSIALAAFAESMRRWFGRRIAPAPDPKL